MKHAGPLFDPNTMYRIEIEGRIDVEWLQGFDSSVEISADESREAEELTAIVVHTDQSGIVGLVRRMNGLGMKILQFQIITQQGD